MARGNKHLLSADVISLARGKKRPPARAFHDGRGGMDARNDGRDGFGKEEQVRLFELFEKLDKKGCYIMLSNHNTKLIRDLYKNYNINVIKAKRNINANGKKRGNVEEVLITNYKKED